MRFALAVFIFAWLLPARVLAQPDGTITYNGHFYAFYSAGNWCLAQNCGQPEAIVFASNTIFCNVPGHLADLKDMAEDNYVADNLVRPKNSFASAWIGLKYDSSDTKFEWSDKTPATYVHFPGGDPSNPPNDPIIYPCVYNNVYPIGAPQPTNWSNTLCDSTGLNLLLEFDCVSTSAPVSLAPVSKAPISIAPISKSPISDVPVSLAPVSKTPISKAPVTKTPVTKAPVTKAPVTNAPVTNAPVTKAPVTKAPVTMAPVVASKVPTRASQAPVTVT
jgi:hypothetical protein